MFCCVLLCCFDNLVNRVVGPESWSQKKVTKKEKEDRSLGDRTEDLIKGRSVRAKDTDGLEVG